jgi:ubiquitin C-terminal hydrolase
MENIFDFILHIDKNDNAISVSNSLNRFFLGEEMKGENQVFCERCCKKTDSYAVPHPVKLSEYLIITIGLF